jgi:hypothetical protein
MWSAVAAARSDDDTSRNQRKKKQKQKQKNSSTASQTKKRIEIVLRVRRLIPDVLSFNGRLVSAATAWCAAGTAGAEGWTV